MRPSATAAQVDGTGQVLSMIRQGTQTVSQLAQAMDVARSTIIQRLEYLEQWGLIRRIEPLPGQRGRPAATSAFDPSGGVVLAAQIGATGFRAALTSLDGTVLREQFVETGVALGSRRVQDALMLSFLALLEDHGASADDLAGIGLGMPSDLDLSGMTDRESREPWDAEHLKEVLQRRFGVRVFLELDVNMLGIAEHRLSWPDAEVLVCLKLGTLINASIVVNGEPVRGAKGLAGELGHMKVDGSVQPCSCGRIGCLDSVAGGQALVRDLRAAGRTVEHVRDVIRLADDGDPDAVHALRSAGMRIGQTLASVVNLLNPTAITAWGYLAESAVLFAGIREGLHANALPASAQDLVLVGTSLGSLAGSRGAALRVIDEVLSPEEIDRAIVRRGWSPPV
ncbi:ROK family transcriptional regulator [Microbacterium sp. CIAB417]|uniref:ROK family transcriptional regulator n=1 Tax=Microbacterium sp. CIAB417 TaxID=2860287 RepID=UPI001FAE467D|nr:ROK family transcriptional regulator [Microbacterium sp. CIAB417]